MEQQGILEPSQDGSLPLHQTRHPVAKLQQILGEAYERKQKVYLVYIDWFNAFCSLDIARLLAMLDKMGLHPDDVSLLRELYTDTWLRVSTYFGDTAEVPTNRGSLQGDTLSPSILAYFINLCLCLLDKAGWGLLLKRAWHLTDGQGVAMFVLPPELGCIADQQPAVLLAKHTINLTMSLAHSLDGEMLLLMEEEWLQMQKQYCIEDIKLGQLMVLLEEDCARPSTLLRRLMYACGLCGLTFNWKGFQHPEYTSENPPPDTLLQHLAGYLWTRITGYWKTG
eukprot:3940583-Rhodomonas_salina.7